MQPESTHNLEYGAEYGKFSGKNYFVGSSFSSKRPCLVVFRSHDRLLLADSWQPYSAAGAGS